MNKKLNDIFEKQLEPLSEKEKEFFYGLRNKIDKIWKTIKPIAVAFALFYLFGKVYDVFGYERTIFVLLVIVVIYLRLLNSKIGELLG